MQLDNRVLIDQVEDLARILHLWNEQIIIGGGVALVLYDLQKINMTMGHVAVELVERFKAKGFLLNNSALCWACLSPQWKVAGLPPSRFDIFILRSAR